MFVCVTVCLSVYTYIASCVNEAALLQSSPFIHQQEHHPDDDANDDNVDVSKLGDEAFAEQPKYICVFMATLFLTVGFSLIPSFPSKNHQVMTKFSMMKGSSF